MRTSKTKALVALAMSLGVFAAAFHTISAQGRSDSVSRSCALVQGLEVCTWFVSERGQALELGATIPIELIEGVSIPAEMVWPPRQMGTVPLPAEARSALGIDHLAINWEAHGHPPATFLAPHFDFHFYNITESEVAAIDCVDESKPADLPTGYRLPDIDVPGMGIFVGLCVPHMGMHALVEDEIDATDAFDASLVLGYYGAVPIFFEPMVSRDRLLERSSFTLAVPAIEELPVGVRYPTEVRAEYDAVAGAYRLVMSGFPS